MDSLWNPVGTILSNGKPLVCDSEGCSMGESSPCYLLEEGHWKKITDDHPFYCLYSGTETVLVPNVGWWVSGGGFADNNYNHHYVDKSFIYKEDTNTWTDGPKLPVETSHHCIVQFNDLETMLIPGRITDEEYSTKSWIYNWGDKTWTSYPNGPRNRSAAACGYDPISNTIVVAGGLEGYTFSTTVDVFDVDTKNWSIGPDIPIDMILPSMAVNATSIVLTGSSPFDGQDGDEYLYQYHGDCWLQIEVNTSNDRRKAQLALFAPNSVFDHCK